MFKELIRRFRYIHKKPEDSFFPAPPKPKKHISQWEPKHPHLQLNLSEKIHPQLQQAIQKNRTLEFIETIGPSLYRFPVFDEQTQHELNNEIKTLLSWVKTRVMSEDI